MKRNCCMVLRFTREELDTLTKKARKTQYSREGFCRAILNGAVVHESPPADFFNLIRIVKRTGSNLDQLLKLAYANGFLDAPAIRKALEHNLATEKMLWETFFPGKS